MNVERSPEVAVQPVHDYSISFEDESTPLQNCTHLGTDYGRMGPGERHLSWKKAGEPGYIRADLTGAGWAGLWHSLAGLASERDRYLDFAKCYPHLRDDYQPRCVGMTIGVRGDGYLKLELKSPNDRVLWWATREICTDDWRELEFSFTPDDLRRVKFLDWSADPGSQLDVRAIRLLVQMPDVPFAQRVFLESYAKLARLYSPNDGTVKEVGHLPAGERDSVPASGLFCLATCAGFTMGVLKRVFAEQTLQKINGTISGVPGAGGLLPWTLRKYGGKYRIHHGTQYSALGTSVYYHSMFLAAQMLWEAKTLAGLSRAVRQIEFDRLHDANGYLLHGLGDDGRTPSAASYREWGGETALVHLLEYLATAAMTRLKLEGAGKVRDGIGCGVEMPALFYPDFGAPEPDSISGADWLAARRNLQEEQKSFARDKWAKSPAARLGFYGYSSGWGAGYAAEGTRSPGRPQSIHPRYLLMSGVLESQPEIVYSLLRTMETEKLLLPWGMVESFSKDLEPAPLMGSLSAAFESIGAYHLWAKAAGKRDYIFRAAEYCPFTWEAARAFFPSTSRW